jgi:hypothetical protein
MSKKSRQPEGSGKADKKGKKAKKGKGADADAAQRRLVVESRPQGVPFPIVVLLAAVMTLPSVTNYMGGGLEFDALMVRALAALAVSWLLAGLVYAVFESMRPTEVTAVVELPPEQAYDAVAARGALSGTIVEDPLAPEPDPFAIDPVAPLPAADSIDPLDVDPERGEPAA